MLVSLSPLLLSAIFATLMWLGLFVLPWRPWSTRETISTNRFEPKRVDVGSVTEITVLIPARNEASCIQQTLTALTKQGPIASVIVIDDQSEDETKAVAQTLIENAQLPQLTIIDGEQPPEGWSGKLWALHQGLTSVKTPYVMLLDADIELAENMVATLQRKLVDNELDSVSVMASLYMGSWAEKLLLPPFIYFFKIIYPFHLANSPSSKMAAAAGGCVLMKTSRLREIGGFESLKTAIIDDCTLAKRIKDSGGNIWVGLSHDVRAVRPYETLANIWNMVARTAFTQLHYSIVLLLLCTVLMVIGYLAPVSAILAGDTVTKIWGGIALGLLCASYYPTTKYYDLPSWWCLTLPLAAALFLAMTWTSAYRYLRGERSRWKNRSYARESTE
ncbi:MAG: glycosyltransferase [Pseudomonadota bacterium]